MKRLCGFFIIIFALCVLSNCGSPSGSIDGSGGIGGPGSDYDALWVTSITQFYEVTNSFDRLKDFTVISSDRGVIQQLDPGKVGVTISEISMFGTPIDPYLFPDDVFVKELIKPGIYRVEITYKLKSTNYTFEVRGYYTPPGDGDWGMVIKWL